MKFEAKLQIYSTGITALRCCGIIILAVDVLFKAISLSENKLDCFLIISSALCLNFKCNTARAALDNTLFSVFEICFPISEEQ